MIGIALGLVTGLLFAAGTVLARVGQRNRPDDDGLVMTILVNVLVLGGLAMTVEAPTWSTSAIVALMVGGVLGSLLGRLTMLRAVRLVGPTRSSAFMTGSPVVAAIAGLLILGEEVGVLDGIGGLLVIGGLLALIRSQSTPTALVGDKPELATKRQVRIGYAFATAAPLFFGLGFVVKKWGLLDYPEPVLGAFIGSVAAFSVVVLISRLNGITSPNRSKTSSNTGMFSYCSALALDSWAAWEMTRNSASDTSAISPSRSNRSRLASWATGMAPSRAR